MRNEEEPHYWSDVNLQDVGLSIEADEEISSEASVKKQFDKMEFLNEFQKAVNDVITYMITKVVEKPQGSQHSKQLCEKKAMPPPKTNGTSSVTRSNSIDLHPTQEMDKLISHFVRSDSGSTDQI